MSWWSQSPVGCVLAVEPGVLTVLSDDGSVRATLDGSMLAAIAQDATERPSAGEWVRLRSWPDGRVTATRRLVVQAAEGAAVLPFARRA